jgi:hypothetical protein
MGGRVDRGVEISALLIDPGEFRLHSIGSRAHSVSVNAAPAVEVSGPSLIIKTEVTLETPCERKSIKDQRGPLRETKMKMKLSIALSTLLITGFLAASSQQASAVVYCQYVSYPAGCIVRPGVVLRPRPVARAVVTPGVGAAGVGVRAGTPMNRGGPVNRVGRR